MSQNWLWNKVEAFQNAVHVMRKKFLHQLIKSSHVIEFNIAATHFIIFHGEFYPTKSQELPPLSTAGLYE